jgi:hypothetical protein
MKVVKLATVWAATIIQTLMILRVFSIPRIRLVTLVVLLVGAPRLLAQTGASNVLETRSSTARVAVGIEEKVQVTVSVKEGFKVAKRPAPKLQISQNSLFTVTVISAFTESVPGKDADYFGGLNPLELKLVPERTTKPGKYSVEGKVTYFYCAERDKHCSRSVENLKFPVEVIEKK